MGVTGRCAVALGSQYHRDTQHVTVYESFRLYRWDQIRLGELVD